MTTPGSHNEMQDTLNSIRLVAMAPDHFRAYKEWLDSANLRVGRWPGVLPADTEIYIVTPAYSHPRGKRG